MSQDAFIAAVEDWLEHPEDAAAEAALAARLRAEPTRATELAALWRQHRRLHVLLAPADPGALAGSVLAELAGRSRPRIAFASGGRQRSASTRRVAARGAPARSWPRRLAALAAFLLAALGLAMLATEPESAAIVLDGDLRRSDGAPIAGGRLPAGSAVSALTPALLRFPDGSTVALAAGARLAVQPAAGLAARLDDGRLTATVTPRGSGRFAIATAEGVASVLGTRFTLDRAAGRTVVTVDEGHVRLTQGATAIEVAGGERGAASVAGVARLPHDTWHSTTIGDLRPAAVVRGAGPRWSLSGCGGDLYANADQCQFIWRDLDGDGVLTVRVAAITPTTEKMQPFWSKAGLMLRCGLRPEAANVAVLLTAGQGAGVQWRSVASGETADTWPLPANQRYGGGGPFAPGWLRLTRRGDEITGEHSSDGLRWRRLGSARLTLPHRVQVGLVVASHLAGLPTAAEFEHLDLLPHGGQP